MDCKLNITPGTLGLDIYIDLLHLGISVDIVFNSIQWYVIEKDDFEYFILYFKFI
jgi:hypothetical protein